MLLLMGLINHLVLDMLV